MSSSRDERPYACLAKKNRLALGAEPALEKASVAPAQMYCDVAAILDSGGEHTEKWLLV